MSDYNLSHKSLYSLFAILSIICFIQNSLNRGNKMLKIENKKFFCSFYLLFLSIFSSYRTKKIFI